MSFALNHIKSMLGLNEKLFRDARGARIVVYHGICQSNPTLINSLFVTTATFQRHLQFYSRYFNIVSLDDYFAGRLSNDRFNICITFDDGFANNYRHALPLIEKYQIPAAFFITAIRQAGYDILWNDHLALLQKFGPSQLSFENNSYRRDRHHRYLSSAGDILLRQYLLKDRFPKKAEFMRQTSQLARIARATAGEDYWLQMTEEEIAWLASSPYATIGCHGYYHNDLSMLALADATAEMVHSRQYLEKITGRKVQAIAFPYGAYTREVVAAADETAGFRQLLAVDFLYPEDKDHPLIRERMTVNPYISIYNQMTAIVRGHYNF
ncbi:MAG: polysaccharide deacetylase family protein [Chitinophagaceae bacterium]|nr:polysaccharide deacetylase family protein [Chitinophagaceae bacterium]